MEFCENRTLRVAIDSGELFDDRNRMWRIYRQIVEGIAFIHSKNHIHRDLKPENVFLNYDYCAKIGDFGLATLSGIDAAPADGNNFQQNLTRNCGTHLYMAPELASSNYDTKVDMYSLGIISFEMCHRPFETEEERIEELIKLRDSAYESLSCVLPSPLEEMYMKLHGPLDFPLSTKDMGDLIVKLLDHDPKKRPSAQDLLRSKKQMPPPLFDKQQEFFQRVENIISSRKDFEEINTDNVDYHHIMQLCMEQNTPEEDIFNWLYCRKESKATLSRNDSSLTIYRHQPDIFKHFIGRCQEAGARYFQPATLFPKLSTEEDYKTDELKKLATILESNFSPSFMNIWGTQLVLPIESYSSFARHVASFGLIELKRFCIQQIYRTDHSFASGNPPEPSDTEMVLDIVSAPSSTSKDLRQADAEVIQVIGKVLNDCELSFVVLQLSHRKLIDAILIYCKIPEHERSKICGQLEKQLTDLRVKGVEELANFHSDKNAHLRPIFDLLFGGSGPDLNNVRDYFNGLPDWNGGDNAFLADEAFGELEEIIDNLSQANDQNGLNCTILISLTFGLEYYDTHSGFMFNFIHELRSTNELAKGGRYDGLVHSFRKVMTNCAITKLRNEFGKSNKELDEKQHVTGGAIHLNNLLIATRKCKNSFPNY